MHFDPNNLSRLLGQRLDPAMQQKMAEKPKSKTPEQAKHIALEFLGQQKGILTPDCPKLDQVWQGRAIRTGGNDLDSLIRQAMNRCKKDPEALKQLKALQGSINTILDKAGPENRDQITKTLVSEVLPAFVNGDNQTKTAILQSLNNTDALASLDQARIVDKKYQSAINDINKNISNTNTRIQTLSSSIQTNTNTINRNNASIKANEARIKQLEAELLKLKEKERNRSTLQAQIDSLKATNTKLALTNTQLGQSNADMTAQITTLNADLVTYRDQLTKAPKPTCVNNWLGFATNTVQQTVKQPTQRDAINTLYTSLSQAVAGLTSSKATLEALVTLNSTDDAIYGNIPAPSTGTRRQDYTNNITKTLAKHLSDSSLVSQSDKIRIFTEIPTQYASLSTTLNEGVAARIQKIKADPTSDAYAQLFWNRPGPIPASYIRAVNNIANKIDKMYVGEFDLNVRADGTIGNDIRAWSTTVEDTHNDINHLDNNYLRYDLLFNPATQKITDISDENPLPLYQGNPEQLALIEQVQTYGVLT